MCLRIVDRVFFRSFKTGDAETAKEAESKIAAAKLASSSELLRSRD